MNTQSSRASGAVPDEVDVVIIGAGIAGLAAAHALIQSGLTVTVVEARDRVGGRLLSRRISDTSALDLGATWFWPGEARVEELVRELRVKVFPQHLSGDAIYHDHGGSKRIDGNSIDVPAVRFATGADTLSIGLAHLLPSGIIRLSCPVDRIDATGERVIASTKNGAVSAPHCILAVPPALAVSHIEFAPALPDRVAGLAAITPVWMGAITKVVAHYSEPFWRAAALAGSGISHVGPMREVHDMSGPDGNPAALFAFAQPTTDGQGAATRAAVLEQLVEMFGPEAGNPAELIIHDWSNEAWTSPPGVEKLTAYQTYGHALFNEPALGGRLHWASTETATLSPGHIEGALAAAERAVQAILADLAHETL